MLASFKCFWFWFVLDLFVCFGGVVGFMLLFWSICLFVLGGFFSLFGFSSPLKSDKQPPCLKIQPGLCYC